MTYTKEERAEEMETEIREDNIRDEANEQDSGDFDTWIGNNIVELTAQFIDNYNDEWKEFCKDRWNEENE